MSMRRPRPPAPLEPQASFGFTAQPIALKAMSRAHLHGDVELACCVAGHYRYSLNGRSYRCQAGEVQLVWSGVPHQVLQASPDCRGWQANIPVPWFLGWDLPVALVERLIGGEPLVDPQPDALVHEIHAWERWQQLLATSDRTQVRIAALEIEARIRRLLLHVPGTAARARAVSPGVAGSYAVVERMMRYLTQHAADATFTVGDVARHAGLNPQYAATLFRRHTGRRPHEYLLQQRVAVAQRLLLLTDRKGLDLAAACGFNSPARFYVAFKRFTGLTPQAYRRKYRPAAEPR